MIGLYRWLLRCYPPGFRARFGDELVDAFDEGIRASRRRGLMPTVAFALTRLADVVSSGIAERRAERTTARRAGHSSGAGSRVAVWSLQDLGFGIRAMRREPEFSLVVVATLALAIGANTAVFSILDVVLLRSLP